MKSINDRVAYLRGLGEGLNLNNESNEGIVLTKIIEVLEEMVEEFENVYDEIDEMGEYIEELEEYVDIINDDLEEVEDEFYDEDCGCGCGDDEYDDMDWEEFHEHIAAKYGDTEHKCACSAPTQIETE